MSTYDNFLAVGYLNSEATESAMCDFCEMYHMQK